MTRSFFRLKYFVDQNFLTQKLLTKIQRLSKLNTLDLSLVRLKSCFVSRPYCWPNHKKMIVFLEILRIFIEVINFWLKIAPKLQVLGKKAFSAQAEDC